MRGSFPEEFTYKHGGITTVCAEASTALWATHSLIKPCCLLSYFTDDKIEAQKSKFSSPSLWGQAMKINVSKQNFLDAWIWLGYRWDKGPLPPTQGWACSPPPSAFPWPDRMWTEAKRKPACLEKYMGLWVCSLVFKKMPNCPKWIRMSRALGRGGGPLLGPTFQRALSSAHQRPSAGKEPLLS